MIAIRLRREIEIFALGDPSLQWLASAEALRGQRTKCPSKERLAELVEEHSANLKQIAGALSTPGTKVGQPEVSRWIREYPELQERAEELRGQRTKRPSKERPGSINDVGSFVFLAIIIATANPIWGLVFIGVGGLSLGIAMFKPERHKPGVRQPCGELYGELFRKTLIIDPRLLRSA